MARNALERTQMRKVIVCCEPDAAAMEDSIRALLAEEPIELLPDHGTNPELWEAAVFLFLVTPRAIASLAFAERAKQIVVADLPIVPVVSDFSTFDFPALPPDTRSMRA